MKHIVDKLLAISFVGLIGAVGGMLMGWMILGSPGSHALDQGLEPSLWLTDDERGQYPTEIVEP
jgi:hypothetical protein